MCEPKKIRHPFCRDDRPFSYPQNFLQNASDDLSHTAISDIIRVAGVDGAVIISVAVKKMFPVNKFYIFISAFDRKKAKTFAFYGTLTLILGRFVAFKIYYTVVGCLLLLFAVILIIFAPKTSGGKT